jgi:hypothetical protein
MGEEMSGNVLETPTNNNNLLPSDPSGPSIHQQGLTRAFGSMGSNNVGPVVDIPGSDGRRYYTIQRVNGNGGNGKFDGTAGPHQHSLQESDRVKKNSVLRRILTEEKANKKTQVSPPLLSKRVLMGRECRSELFNRQDETPHRCIPMYQVAFTLASYVAFLHFLYLLFDLMGRRCTF